MIVETRVFHKSVISNFKILPFFLFNQDPSRTGNRIDKLLGLEKFKMELSNGDKATEGAVHSQINHFFERYLNMHFYFLHLSFITINESIVIRVNTCYIILKLSYRVDMLHQVLMTHAKYHIYMFLLST